MRGCFGSCERSLGASELVARGAAWSIAVCSRGVSTLSGTALHLWRGITLRRPWCVRARLAQLDLWRDHAMATLPVLMRATDMLVCGEDLGFLAPCVHPLMTELGLVGARPPPARPEQPPL